MSNLVLLVVFITVITTVTGEPVKHCLDEVSFQRAGCSEIIDHVAGTWVEVRRLPLPIAMYNDDDCVIWESSPVIVNETYAEFRMEAFIDDIRVDGMDPAFLTLKTDQETGSCSVSMYLTIPKISKSIAITDWWITFGEDHQSMVGYVCLPNDDQNEVDAGFPVKNMVFAYVKPQWRHSQIENVKANLQEIVTRISAELKETEQETRENYKELEYGKCGAI